MSKKYLDLLRCGKALFWKYGLKKVSVEEICRESSVSKMTFYKYFPSKMDLAVVIYKQVMEESMAAFREAVNAPIEFTERLHLLYKIKMDAARGISADFIKDINEDIDGPLIQLMHTYGSASLNLFRTFIEEAKRKGEIRAEVKFEFIQYYMNSMSAMMEDEILLSKYDQPHDLIMEAMDFMFYGIGKKK